MKKLKCVLGLHEYEYVGIQQARGVVGVFSMNPLIRQISKCKLCSKIHIFGFDVSNNTHLDESIDWQPKLTAFFRQQKLEKLGIKD